MKDVGLTDNDLLGKIAQVDDILGSKINFQGLGVHEIVGLHQHV